MDSSSAGADRPRIAYLISSHTLPRQVLRLASVLRRGSPGASLVIHHDDRQCKLDAVGLDRLGVRRIEPPSAVAWGEASQLAMVLRCLDWLVEHEHFDWIVLISGQDYPIRPLAEIERSLAASEFDALIKTQPCERPTLGAPVDEFAARYHLRWRMTQWRGLGALARASGTSRFVRVRAMPSGTWVGVRALRSPFGPGLVCQRGPDWFALSRAAALAVQRFVRARPDLIRYYRRTLHPTESFVHTVLANDPSLRLSGDNRRYSIWDQPHMTGPRVLRLDDLEAMLASGGDFARKFDETLDRAVLDEIDRRVHAASEPAR
jgi:core-2/I-Branching enzyme